MLQEANKGQYTRNKWDDRHSQQINRNYQNRTKWKF